MPTDYRRLCARGLRRAGGVLIFIEMRETHELDKSSQSRLDRRDVCFVEVFKTITVTADNILRFQGYRARPAPPQVRDSAELAARTANALIEPAAAFVFVPIMVDSEMETVRVRNGPTFHSRYLGRYFRPAHGGAAFVATIGSALERRVDELHSDGDDVGSILLDCAGVLAIHSVVSQVRSCAARPIRKEGYRLVGRMGPGHGDWSLRDQPALFSLFGGCHLPASLSSHCIMTPAKSMSGFIAVVPSGSYGDGR